MDETDLWSRPTGTCPNCGRPHQPNFITCPGCGLFQTASPLTDSLPPYLQTRQITKADLRASGLPLAETTYLALGGGLGSFSWVDYLRVCGAATRQITVIGSNPLPYARFRKLCRISQINDQERLRSESSARPDNLWGWPGYALHEIVDLLGQQKWGAAAKIGWQIFTEPTLAHTYTPHARTVYKTLNREMRRIGWSHMFQKGEICAIRQTDDGRFAVLYRPLSRTNGRPRFIIAPYLHLALGYPGICLTTEALAYRRTYQDWRRVVQAYENHEHIYAHLARQGGLVVLRGRGIVASRILQQIAEIRQKTGQQIQVIHLLRAPVTEQTSYGRTRRTLQHHRQVQPFNWPKATFGGELREVMEQASPQQRKQLAAIWGGTTTSDRPDWQEVVNRAVEEGWYSFVFGTISEIMPNGRNRLIIKTRENQPPHQDGRLIADFIFDCTGLNTQAAQNPLLADLTSRYDLPQTHAGGWQVTADFEVKALRNGPGQLFAAGVTTAGNAFAPVDSFLGLQYAAQRATERLVQEHAPNLKPLKGRESLRQWWRWVNNQNPTPKN